MTDETVKAWTGATEAGTAPIIEKPDSWHALLASMTPDVHQRLKTAVELGRWPNGERLSAEQLEYSLQAIIAWDQLHLPEHERVAYVDRSKSSCHSEES